MKGKCKWSKPNEWHRRWSTRGQTRQVDKTNIGIGKLEGGMDNEHILYDSIIANYLCSHLDSICLGSTSSILLRHAACTSFHSFEGLKFNVIVFYSSIMCCLDFLDYHEAFQEWDFFTALKVKTFCEESTLHKRQDNWRNEELANNLLKM